MPRLQADRLARSAGIWLLFVFCTALAAFIHGTDRNIHLDPLLDGTAEGIGTRWSVEQMQAHEVGRPMYRGSDAASFLSAGQRLIELHHFENDYVKFWPAAMGFLSAGVLVLTGGESYPLKMIAFNVVLWASCLFISFLCLPLTRRRAVDAALWLSFFLLPAFRAWMFGLGSLMSEGPSHAIFVASVSMLVRAILDRSILLWIAAAVSMGIAAHFRSVFETFGKAMFLIPLIFGTAWVIIELWRRKSPHALPILKCLFAGWLAFTLTLLPWRLYKKERFGHSEWYYQTERYKYGPQWMTDAEVARLPFANTGCKIDPQLCAAIQANTLPLEDRTYRDLMFMTFFAHPGKWLSFRIKNGHAFWFGATKQDLPAHPALIVEGGILLLTGVGGLAGFAWVLWRRRSDEAVLQVACAFGVFLALNLSIFLFFHMEWRYSQSIRTFAYYLPLWVLAINRRRRDNSAPPR